MSDAPTLYDHDGETIERVINEECAAAMRSHIDDLESRIREQRALLDECGRALAALVNCPVVSEMDRDAEWGCLESIEAEHDAQTALAKLRSQGRG